MCSSDIDFLASLQQHPVQHAPSERLAASLQEECEAYLVGLLLPPPLVPQSAHVYLREDPRNKNGGAWAFRVPKANSQEFWKEILMMAIGEILQEVVAEGEVYATLSDRTLLTVSSELQEMTYVAFPSAFVSTLTSS